MPRVSKNLIKADAAEVRVALCQMTPEPANVQANLAKVVAAVEALADSSDLIVLPECALTGYMLTADEAGGVAESIPGQVTKVLTTLARERNVMLIAGMLERRGSALHNIALLCDRDGEVYVYRKSHLPRMGVDRWCVPGSDGFYPFKTTLGKLGIEICYDFRFPEPSRLLALRGSELLVLIAAWPVTATDYPEFINRCRAAENRVAVVAAACAGEERGTRYLGRSQIIRADGSVVAEAGSDPTVLTASLSKPGTGSNRHVLGRPDGPGGLLADRRPELYAAVMG